MKNIRKILAVILCFAMLMTVCIPLASAEELAEDTTQITQETPENEVPETEKSYLEKTEESFANGLKYLERGGLTLASFFVSPLVILFPMTSAVGMILFVTGLPMGIGCLGAGIGQIVGAPIIALFK